MQVLYVNLLRNIRPEVLKRDLDEIIEGELNCNPISLEVNNLSQGFKDYLKRSIVNQWGIPFIYDEQTAYQTSYINSFWKSLRCGAEMDIKIRTNIKKGLEREVINQLELGQLVEVLSKKFCQDKRWAYQLCYGVGIINFYESPLARFPQGLIVSMTNDLGFFDEFDDPVKPNLSYSAKLIFAGFVEKINELNSLKFYLHQELSKKKHYLLI